MEIDTLVEVTNAITKPIQISASKEDWNNINILPFYILPPKPK